MCVGFPQQDRAGSGLIGVLLIRLARELVRRREPYKVHKAPTNKLLCRFIVGFLILFYKLVTLIGRIKSLPRD
jgi:predicted membrane protein